MSSSANGKNILKDKSFRFAVEIVHLSDFLLENFTGYRLPNQILGSGTSIGATIREAGQAESAADFVHKLSIALKECDETIYWLDLLVECNKISSDQYSHLKTLAFELQAMLTASIMTVKKKTGKLHGKTAV